MALVGSAVNHADAGTRLVFERDSQGRIERAIGRQVGGSDAAIVYRYDGAGRLALARSLYGDGALGTLNQAIGYHAVSVPQTPPLRR